MSDVTTWTIQLKKGIAEYIVLLTLADGEAYGYEILQTLMHVDHLAFGESTVYPVLGRLCREGHLDVRVANSEKGPPRRYYRLTSAGKNRLHEMDRCWKELLTSVEHTREGTHNESR